MKKLLFFLALLPIQVMLAQSDGLTPSDIAKLEYVSTAKISEDGNKIAYTVDFDPDSSNYGRHITYFRTYSYFVRAVRSN